MPACVPASRLRHVHAVLCSVRWCAQATGLEKLRFELQRVRALTDKNVDTYYYNVRWRARAHTRSQSGLAVGHVASAAAP
jgi:hypothetical protein